MIKLPLCLMMLSLTLAGCVSTADPSVDFPPRPQDDDDYFASYQRNSRHQEVIQNFETKYAVHVTQLVADFREAMAKRYQVIFNEPQPVLAEASTQAGFFVSAFVADTDARDLSDSEVWNIQLKRGDNISKPALIKQLRPKSKWQPFFPEITTWSREYLVLFEETPSPGDTERELVKSTTTELIFNHPNGRVRLTW